MATAPYSCTRPASWLFEAASSFLIDPSMIRLLYIPLRRFPIPKNPPLLLRCHPTNPLARCHVQPYHTACFGVQHAPNQVGSIDTTPLP